LGRAVLAKVNRPAPDHKRIGVVAEAIVKETPHPGIAQMIASRAERGIKLYLSRRQLITKTGPDTYTVPASGDAAYAVRYGGEVESCECVDFSVHGGQVPCKHLIATALMFAARRRSSEGRLRELEERYRHELTSDEERQELRDRIIRLRKRRWQGRA
jgi:hypothetical protein